MIKTTILSEYDPTSVLETLSPRMLTRVLRDIMTGARRHWMHKAEGRLDSSLRDYLDGIQEVEYDEGAAWIELMGTLPNMIEHGIGSFAMHDTLLQSGAKGVKTGKDGARYRSIPFRHKTPSSKTSSGGAIMGSAYAGHPLVKNSAELGKAIHKAAKGLDPSRNGSWGGRLPDGLAPKLKPIHSTDIYAGMVRVEKKYDKATQYQYKTFRTISENRRDKWIHPGIEAVNLADDVHSYVESIAADAINAILPPDET